MQTGASEEKAVRLLDPGDMFGDYTVEKLLGQGGMGAVYLVRAPGGERYAVKVMFPDMVKKGSDYRKRFAREAEFAMQIHHKNLISVYDVGEDPETGLCYIIMDYVPGGSVAEWRTAWRITGPCRWRRRCRSPRRWRWPWRWRTGTG